MILVSIRHTARSSQNTGIQRVVRGFSRYASEEPQVRFVEWRNWKNGFFELMPRVSEGMGQFGGPVLGKTSFWLPFPKTFQECKVWLRYIGMRRHVPLHLHPRYSNQEGWLLLPELMTAEMMKEAVEYGKAMGLKVAVILYDCIAYFHPEWVNKRIRENHRGYLHAAADSDLVISISQTTAGEYQRFLREEKREGARVVSVPLAEEFLGMSRTHPQESFVNLTHRKIKILYVSTLDPRKNHLRLLNAFQKIRESHPDLNIELTLVGHRYDGAIEIAQAVEEFQKRDLFLIWREGVDDATLASLYDECDFTVFPSLTEGYGLPIVESLWRGKPCVCSGLGSMLEIADQGGCLTVDPFSAESIREGLLKIIEDRVVRERLYQEIKKYNFKSWEKYSNEILDCLS